MRGALAAGGGIPSYAHRDGDGDVECAVCLGEVEQGEAVRRLPACQHVCSTPRASTGGCAPARERHLPGLPVRPPPPERGPRPPEVVLDVNPFLM
jgi:hypothetical protein